MDLNTAIRNLLADHGADLIGIGDVADLAPDGYRYAIVAAIALPVDIVEDIPNGPTPAYQNIYKVYNDRLDAMATAVEALLTAEGHRTLALTRANAPWNPETAATAFPYKTAATRAGLGWIGKSALLVTPQYGSAVRLTVVLTDAPLTPDAPITESRCGSCHACADACPGNAIRNTLWYPGIDRAELVDIPACQKAAGDRAEVTLGVRTTICGRCFAACPYTRGYLNRSKK